MIVSKKTFFLGILWIITCLYYAICGNSLINMAVLSALTTIITTFVCISIDGNRFSYSTVLLLYTLATQFGLVIPYVFIGPECVDSYASWTLKFLSSGYLPYALFLGNIAVISLSIGKSIAKKNHQYDSTDIIMESDESEARKMYVVSLGLLGFVLMFFLINIARGGMSLFSTYQDYMSGSAYNSSFYSFVLVFFYVGTLYLAASGEIMHHKVGWIIWIAVSAIFALNGNKGEFMYSLLAVIGMKGVEGKKISAKTVFLLLLVLFLVIPSITAFRNIGLVGNMSFSSVNFTDSFIEMGMQIRMSVYVLEDLNNGIYGHLHGASYYQPIINFIPFLKGLTATHEIRTTYAGYGFNQVIESYLNFGFIGVVAFFGIIGGVISKFETSICNRLDLAYLGTITCILINATRNYFAFVPGQIVIVTVIWIVVRKINIFAPDPKAEEIIDR